MSAFPTTRLRRLRRTGALRSLVRETRLDLDDFVQPLFVGPDTRANAELPPMGRFSVDDLSREVEELERLGVSAVILFGIPDEKDEEGSGAWDEDGVVQRALRELRPRFPELLLLTDVCLCEYTSHGHCGVIRDGEVANDESLELIARTAVSHVEAGADAVCPSDMMDGRVAAIREQLPDTPILAYSAKYASAFYGPFREAAESAPSFGDRRSYQMDPANVREALRECELDLAEGADVIMVKPALPYLDVIRAVRERFDAPVAAYNVSGEYAMVKAGARHGLARRARRGARVADRDQARRRRSRRLVLDEGARGVALGTRSKLFARARRLIPGGVNSPVRAWRAVGDDDPFFVARGEGAYLEDVEGKRYIDWVMSWGALVFGHADPETVDAITDAARDGTSFGAPTEREVELAEEIADAVPVDRAGAARLVRHRSGDERDPRRAGVHGSRPHPQVRGRLPRPLRRAARRRRFGARDARDPCERGCDDRRGARHDRHAVQRHRRRGRGGRAVRRRASRRSSSSPSPGTSASFRRHPAFSRRCARSPTRPARC